MTRCRNQLSATARASFPLWRLVVVVAGITSCSRVQQVPLPAPYGLPVPAGQDWVHLPVSSGAIRPLPAMPVKSFTLSNGLKLTVVERPGAKTTALRLRAPKAQGEPWGEQAAMVEALRAGSVDEHDQLFVNPRLSGVAISSWTNDGGTTFTWSVLSRATETALHMLGSYVARPAFVQEETLGILRRRLNELQRYSNHMAFVEDFTRAAVPGVHMSSTKELARAMLNLSPKRLAAMHRCSLVPQEAVLAVVGDVQAVPVRTWAEQAFGRWQQPVVGECPGQDESVGEAPKALTKAEVFERFSSRDEPRMLLLYRGPAPSDPDFPAFFLLSRVIEESQNGVFWPMRHAGASYGIHASLNANYRQQSLLEVDGSMQPEHAKQVIQQIVESVRKLSESLSAEEVELSKRKFTTRILGLANTSEGIANELVILNRQQDSPTDIWDGLRKLQAVTVDDCVAVAQKWLDGVPPVALVDGKRSLQLGTAFISGSNFHQLRTREL